MVEDEWTMESVTNIINKRVNLVPKSFSGSVASFPQHIIDQGLVNFSLTSNIVIAVQTALCDMTDPLGEHARTPEP